MKNIYRIVLVFALLTGFSYTNTFAAKGDLDASAGVGISVIASDGSNFVDLKSALDNKAAYSASLRYWVTERQNLGVTVATVVFPSKMYQADLDYRFNFRTDKTLVPFIGANVGVANEGLLTDGSKLTLGLQLGATYNFSEKLGVFVESRSQNIFDNDLTLQTFVGPTPKIDINNILNRFTVGLTLHAK